MSSDFDHFNGWISDASSLTRDKAHSGAYSLVVKPGTEPSLRYDAVLGQLCSSRPDKIYVSAWVWRANSQDAAHIVVEIKDPDTGAPAFRDAIDLGKEVQQFNTWQRIGHAVAVPPMVSATSHMTIHVAAAGTGQPLYLDDLALSLEDK